MDYCYSNVPEIKEFVFVDNKGDLIVLNGYEKKPYLYIFPQSFDLNYFECLGEL